MIIWWIAIGFISRLIIHIPDATPITTLALLAPSFFTLRKSLLMILIMLVTSDLFLHSVFHYPAFGSWSFFTYSGWCSVVLLGEIKRITESTKKMITFSIGASFLFWAWTNFGTWCATSLYPHNIAGLIECYYIALPFLRNSMVGAVCWGAMIFIFLRHNLIHRNIPTFWNNAIHFLKFVRQTN